MNQPSVSHLQIVLTGDGSNTIYNADVGENYHSRHGALQESRHVFLNAGLTYFLEKTLTREVSVLEVGFGTGLNFLLSADECLKRGAALEYTGIEAYPLSSEMIGRTGYQAYLPPNLWQSFLVNYRDACQQSTSIQLNCRLLIATCKLLDFATEKKYDLIYFDAFAAAHQPEMWNEEAIGHTIKFIKPGGIFVTYAITGNLKRLLKSADFKVEKVRGAPGKREMLRATKN
jgi:tRNA U34 5-methylaminomethyl-2-thiouridine-forming methyltransferase MnmC